jgi:2-C-methyl-D-erythritol 2,4-cyclodiphosphate synthase
MEERRVGLGRDTHRLAAGEGRWVGGTLVPCDRRSVAHSDGDVALHALADAVLAACGAEADLGDLFPDDAPEHRARASADFLRAALDRARADGWRVENASIVVTLERPKLGPFKPSIRAGLAALLNLPSPRAGFAAKTAEGLGAVGRGEAWRAEAVVLLARGD